MEMLGGMRCGCNAVAIPVMGRSAMGMRARPTLSRGQLSLVPAYLASRLESVRVFYRQTGVTTIDEQSRDGSGHGNADSGSFRVSIKVSTEGRSSPPVDRGRGSSPPSFGLRADAEQSPRRRFFTDEKTQIRIFLTAASFRRVDYGLQYGVVLGFT